MADEELHFRTEYPDDEDEAEPTPTEYRACTGVQAMPTRDRGEEDAAFISDVKLSRADFGEFKRLRALQQKVHRRR